MAHLREVIPAIAHDPNVCFPMATFRTKMAKTKRNSNSDAPPFYDIIVMKFHEGCVNLKDLVGFSYYFQDLLFHCEHKIAQHLLAVNTGNGNSCRNNRESVPVFLPIDLSLRARHDRGAA